MLVTRGHPPCNRALFAALGSRVALLSAVPAALLLSVLVNEPLCADQGSRGRELVNALAISDPAVTAGEEPSGMIACTQQPNDSGGGLLLAAAGDGASAMSRSELRDMGYQRALAGEEGCREAIPLLQRALGLYREDRTRTDLSSYIRDSSVIDEINILTRLALCHFMVRDDRSFAGSVADLIKTREVISHVPYLRALANPRGGPFQEVAAFLDSWRARFKTDDDKKNALAHIERSFDEVIAFLVENGNTNEALAVSENVRGRAFADLLASKPEGRRSVSAQDTSLQVVPSLAATDYVPLADLLEIVAKHGSTTIEYHVLDDRLLLWIISPDRNQGERIHFLSVPGGDAALRPLVQAFVDRLDRPEATDRSLSDMLRELAPIVFAPIKGEWLPSRPEEPLTIVPHRLLFRIPFAALPATSDARSRETLIDRHAIRIAPSIALVSYAAGLKRARETLTAKPNMAAFINPRPLPSVAVAMHTLDTTEKEFGSIAKIYGAPSNTKIYRREAATLQALREAGAAASVVYLGTHAQADDQDPTRSWIALAGADDVGRVSPSRILDLPLRADLVVLAACQSGRGRITGDGVDGLSRAFMVAGAQALLVSLWEVPEEHTLDLMYHFHREWITERQTKAEALRRAQVAVKQTWPQPELWSGFVLVGE